MISAYFYNILFSEIINACTIARVIGHEIHFKTRITKQLESSLLPLDQAQHNGTSGQSETIISQTGGWGKKCYNLNDYFHFSLFIMMISMLVITINDIIIIIIIMGLQVKAKPSVR